jgi:hypothetical protein
VNELDGGAAAALVQSHPDRAEQKVGEHMRRELPADDTASASHYVSWQREQSSTTTWMYSKLAPCESWARSPMTVGRSLAARRRPTHQWTVNGPNQAQLPI